MRGLYGFFLFAAFLIPSIVGLGEATHPPFSRTEIWIPMRDGVKLSANLNRPSGVGRLPTILVRTPYGKGTDLHPNFQAFVDRGYNVVIQDVRGRYASEGVFAPLSQEPSDGDDTIDWIAAQNWSDGKVGMVGGSYLGFVQWKVAVLNNPHLLAIFPVVSGDDDYRDRIYSPGGAMKWGHRLEWVAENMAEPGYEPPPFQKFIWALPPRQADHLVTGRTATSLLETAFDHPAYDGFWKSISTREKLKDVKTPVFSVGGWYDNYAEGDLDAFSTLHKHSAVDRIIIGPWPHNMSQGFTTMDFGPAGRLPMRKQQMQWFDHWLKDPKTPLDPSPPVKIFVMGINQWRSENDWPLERAVPSKFYLGGSGHANSLQGDGELGETHAKLGGEDRFVYDPHNPVPTQGGAVCCNPKVFPWGPMDQRTVENRRDVLVYSTGRLIEDTEVTGPISLVLFASTSAPDTDFTGKLVDVYPDGRAINLTDGSLRVRYRNGLDKPKLLKPGETVKYMMDLGVTSNVFKKGHRIRLEISSSNFPRFDRNPNTGRAIADETQLVKAQQTVYHSLARRSYLLLPVIPMSAPEQITRAAPGSRAISKVSGQPLH
jgi:putative CocE/NonD family hydrolase